MFLVYVVCKDKSEAKKVAKSLLDKDLVACANMWPIDSMYEWEGDLVEDTEYVLLLKTKKDNYRAVEGEILNQHSYDTPAIFAWQVDKVNENYMHWLRSQC